MTAQIGDKYFFDGDAYSIVAMSERLSFNPVDYGLTPRFACTACWDGYWCDYDISEKGILLKNLYINCADNSYPETNGVSVSDFSEEEHNHWGHHVYENINIPMKYSGKIVVGKGFIQKYYIHMGYQRAWAYETLVELVFEKGVLTQKIDHSGVAEALRKSLDKTGGAQAGESIFGQLSGSTEQFVEESFSLDLINKCWWIDDGTPKKPKR
jgi:hypothetical protein